MVHEIRHKELIIRLLRALFPNARILLFGSRARGTATEYSDIDLALDTGKKLNSLDLIKARNVLEAANIPYKVDIVDVHGVADHLRQTIAKEGIEWAE